MHKNPVLVAVAQTQTLLFQRNKRITASKVYVQKQEMERTNRLRNNTTILISTISTLCSKNNLISYLNVAVIKQVSSDLEVTFY